MWFKTRMGLACIDGTLEIAIERWSYPEIGHSLGIYVYPARNPEVVEKKWFRPAAYTTYNRRIFLVCLPDGHAAADEVLECMQRIEAAIRANDTICDLSDMGADANWSMPGHVPVSVAWPIPRNIGNRPSSGFKDGRS